MSIDHTPETDFEKQAANEFSAGKSDLEAVEGNMYHRTIAIPLTGGCPSCPEGMFLNNGRKKFAGLVISIPLSAKYRSGLVDSICPRLTLPGNLAERSIADPPGRCAARCTT